MNLRPFDELSDYVGEHGFYADPLHHGSLVAELFMVTLSWSVFLGLLPFCVWASRRPYRPACYSCGVTALRPVYGSASLCDGCMGKLREAFLEAGRRAV